MLLLPRMYIKPLFGIALGLVGLVAGANEYSDDDLANSTSNIRFSSSTRKDTNIPIA
jgi:hypothetical protein